jgi:cytolysin-activating lysine-acyltransferase
MDTATTEKVAGTPALATQYTTLRRRMMRRFPDEVARAVRVKRDRKIARVMQFSGPSLPRAEARARLDGYYQGFLTALRQMKEGR